MKVVCVSGYFNPIHIGHIELFKEAKRLGDYLIVIVNNDHQLKLKGRPIFMSEDERVKIVKSIKYVDAAITSLDKDRSVSKTLRAIRPDIFANGGDATEDNCPELEVCREIGCKLVFGAGGGKIRSSSEIIEKLRTDIAHEACEESMG